MNYIYDILVNFKYPLYDFFEWNSNDGIKDLKKIPFYRVSSESLDDFKNKRIKINNILPDIYNQTQVYTNKKKANIEYACVLSDTIEAVAYLFNNKGVLIGKSRLMFSEENEVLRYSSSIPILNIEYEIINNDKTDVYKTRSEIRMHKYLLNEINKIDDIDKLNYIYYECFNTSALNPKSEILGILDSKWDDIGNKLYDFLRSR